MLCRAIIAANQCLLFEPDSPSAQKFREIAIARRQQAAEALELRGSRGPEAAPYLDDSDVPPPFELDMLESSLNLATGVSAAPFIPPCVNASGLCMSMACMHARLHCPVHRISRVSDHSCLRLVLPFHVQQCKFVRVDSLRLHAVSVIWAVHLCNIVQLENLQESGRSAWRRTDAHNVPRAAGGRAAVSYQASDVCSPDAAT